MIVMQYRFTLPADYDISIIERRIGDGGARRGVKINILRHSRRFFICAYKALLPAAP